MTQEERNHCLEGKIYALQYSQFCIMAMLVEHDEGKRGSKGNFNKGLLEFAKKELDEAKLAEEGLLGTDKKFEGQSPEFIGGFISIFRELTTNLDALLRSKEDEPFPLNPSHFPKPPIFC